MEKVLVVLVSLPGTLQKMLKNSIEAVPAVQIIGIAHGGLCAIQLVRELNPDLVLIDSSLPIDETMALIQAVKQEKPGIASIAITDTSQQKRRLDQSGVDYALSSFDFESQIEHILKNRESFSASQI